ncbi:MAG: hypothetical protein R3F62_19420 [Planctomycetota bacterium]
MQTAEGLRELAWLYLKAGLKYLAQDLALRAQERSGGADPELERLFEALRLPVGRRRTTVVDYDPASLGPVPEGSPPLPRPQGHPRPADLQRWKRLELEARYLELDEALFAEAGVDDLARLSPDAAWELCRTLRRLKLFRWESYVTSATPHDPRSAVRFAVLNGADPEKVASVAEAAGASAAARHLAVALWTTREVFYQRDPRVRLRAQELLSAIDPASLDLEGRVERSVARVVCALDAEELPPIRALLPELDALLVEPGLKDGQAQELLEYRALALRAVGDYPEALRTYRAVLTFSPLQPDYLAWAAWCGGMQGSPEVTLPCARTLQSALPRSEFSYVAGLGLAALTAYRPQAVPSLVRRREELLDRGTEYCRALVHAGKPCAQFALPLCRLAVLLSRWEHLEALAEFGASKTADPRPFHTYRAIAAMERTRDPAQGPRAVPEASWPYVQLGLRCWDLRRGLPPASVTAEAERTLAEHPDDPGLALVAAEAFALAGDTARARALWEQARNQLDALGSRQLEVHFAAEWQGRLGD